MNKFLANSIAILLLLINSSPAIAETPSDELPKCIVVSHCVLETWLVNDLDESFLKIVEAVSTTPRIKIIKTNKYYIQAEAKTKWRRYTDDLLVKAIKDKSMIQIRSESRVGIGDKGFNKRRVDDLASRANLDRINYEEALNIRSS